MKSRLAFLLPAVLMITAFAAGCGSSDDSSSDTSSTDAAAKAAFIKKADDVCGTNNKEIQTKVTKELGTQKPNKAVIIKITKDAIIPGLEKQLQDLKALDPPSGSTDDLDTFLSAFADDIQTIKKDPASAVSGDPMKNSTTAAKNYGFDNCGSFGTA